LGKSSQKSEEGILKLEVTKGFWCFVNSLNGHDILMA